MANIKSAKKRILVSAKDAKSNKSFKSEMKTLIKKADEAIADNSANKEEVVKTACAKIDQAVSKNILHKNNAARKKSSFAKKLNASK